MGDGTVAGGGWGGGGVKEEDTGNGLGGAQATSGRGWGQAEPDQASLVHLELQFAALVRCSGHQVQVCLVITAQQWSAQKSKAWSVIPVCSPAYVICISNALSALFCSRVQQIHLQQL